MTPRRRPREIVADGLIPHVRRFLSELRRVELIDRSLALGAQALLALIPLLMVIGAFLPQDWGASLQSQVREAMGIQDAVMDELREAALTPTRTATQTSFLSLVVALASATSFARAMQRMYARVWDLPSLSAGTLGTEITELTRAG